ncbi:hypothetical protein FPQ18DRAFT_390870 [Pyronema domesticum]|nr:hypothetical protein FPQ18DRAFT_390870 [Pyronema domesticum]
MDITHRVSPILIILLIVLGVYLIIVTSINTPHGLSILLSLVGVVAIVVIYEYELFPDCLNNIFREEDNKKDEDWGYLYDIHYHSGVNKKGGDGRRGREMERRGTGWATDWNTEMLKKH